MGCIFITLGTPLSNHKFITMAFKSPHTFSYTSQQKTPVVFDPEKVISRRIRKEKILNIDATVSSFPKISSSSSHNSIIHCSDFSPRVLVYPSKSGQLLSIASPEGKEEEFLVNTPSLSFPPLPEIEEVKYIL